MKRKLVNAQFELSKQRDPKHSKSVERLLNKDGKYVFPSIIDKVTRENRTSKSDHLPKEQVVAPIVNRKRKTLTKESTETKPSFKKKKACS